MVGPVSAFILLFKKYDQTNPDQTSGKFNSRIAYLKKYMELKFATKKLSPQINLPFNFLIQKYFFHDNPTLNINYS